MLTEDIGLFTRGDQCWLWSASGGWAGPAPVADCLCPVDASTGCPANVASLSSLTPYRDTQGNRYLAFTINNELYFSLIKIADGKLSFDWTMAPLPNFSCKH